MGLAVVFPDTIPTQVSTHTLYSVVMLFIQHDSWDFGSGAGFYVDATTEAWAGHYNMYTYVTKELPDLISVRITFLLGLMVRSVNSCPEMRIHFLLV